MTLDTPDYVILSRADAARIVEILGRTAHPSAPLAAERLNNTMDATRAEVFREIIQRQAEWSHRTFGPGTRTSGVLDHIRKELAEVEKDPYDLSEWIDIAILALDGAWRHATREESGEAMLFSEDDPGESDYLQVATIVHAAYVAKLAKNAARSWPDWRTASPDKAIEHVRSDETLPRYDSVLSTGEESTEPPAAPVHPVVWNDFAGSHLDALGRRCAPESVIGGTWRLVE